MQQLMLHWATGKEAALHQETLQGGAQTCLFRSDTLPVAACSG